MNFSVYLEAFAENLAPDQEEVERAENTFDEISQIIEERLGSWGNGVVDRITLNGSLPKNTSIKDMMDIDIIVYVNQHPPFDNIITEFQNIVQADFQNCCVHKNRYGIKFCHNGFNIDLLPARNFVPYGTMGEISHVQQQLALQYVDTVPMSKVMRRYYNTSLSGASVLFGKQKNRFSHSLSRFAKYWSTKVHTVTMKSRSTIMEYVATWVADQLNQFRNQDIVEGFRRFLWLLINLPNLCIVWQEFYNFNDIPDTKLMQRPLLLDPCNPYNNILNPKRNIGLQMNQFRLHAQATLARLNVAEMAFNRGVPVNIEAILG